MQIRIGTLQAIAAGEVTVAFRRWERPRVRPGSTQRSSVGVLEFTSVEPVDDAELTEADATAPGFADLAALRKAQTGENQLYRVGVRLAGPDPRVALRGRARLSAAALAEITSRLERLD